MGSAPTVSILTNTSISWGLLLPLGAPTILGRSPLSLFGLGAGTQSAMQRTTAILVNIKPLAWGALPGSCSAVSPGQ